MVKLYGYARTKDEYATTQLWEYLLRATFSGLDWILSSQQPPSYERDSLRRVDLIVKYMNQNAEERSVLFMEAKKHGADVGEIRTAESQILQAASEYSLDANSTPVWVQACIGTTTCI